MNEKFHTQLIQDLRKSGFYSEMKAIRACTTAKWECRGSFTYFDKDERGTRECDFEAVKLWSSPDVHGSPIRLIGHLLGQVKKSEKPWIVFIDRNRGRALLHEHVELTFPALKMPQGRQVADVLQQRSLIARKNWTATGIHEAFKRPSDVSKWYAAFVSVCKAMESAYDAAVSDRTVGAHFHIFKPVVVVDGILVTAELSADGELLLTETDSAPFAFEYRSDAYDRPNYNVNVVTLEAFPRYLDSVAEQLASTVETLARNRL